MARRKLIRTELKSSLSGAVNDAFSEIESLAEEMGEWRNNMEERLSHTEKFELVSECADQLESCQEMDVPECIAELEVMIVTERKSSKKSPFPRWLRLQNALGALESCKTVAEEHKAKLEENIAAIEEAVEAGKLDQDDDPESKEETLQEAVDEIGNWIDELDTAMQEVENVEFPGMFG